MAKVTPCIIPAGICFDNYLKLRYIIDSLRFITNSLKVFYNNFDNFTHFSLSLPLSLFVSLDLCQTQLKLIKIEEARGEWKEEGGWAGAPRVAVNSRKLLF